MTADGPSGLSMAAMPESSALGLRSPGSQGNPNVAARAGAGETMSGESKEDPSSNTLAEAQAPQISRKGSQHVRGEKSRKSSATEDKDTCRICRQEESTEEPLFYPCKCSGSIKFVHQTCLIQWLSHAQKKHCELCKTTFRFTKLYSPNMPNGVPLLKFLRQAVIHTYKILCTWLRVALVGVVWLGIFPYVMRCVWRGLFWLVEGGWVDWQNSERRTLLADAPSSENFSFQDQVSVQDSVAPGTWLINYHIKNVTATQIVLHVAKTLPSVALKPFSMLLHFDQSGPLLYRLGKGISLMLYSLLIGENTRPTEISPHAKETIPWRVRPSWLSEIEYLKNLTPSPQINLIMVDILEGQLITLSLIIIFVLLFLIREWVIQQHPRNRPANNHENEGIERPTQDNVDQAPQSPPEPATADEAPAEILSIQQPEASINVGPEPRAPDILAQTSPANNGPPREDFLLETTIDEGSTGERRPKMPTREIRDLVLKLAQYREDRRSNKDENISDGDRSLDTIWNKAKISELIKAVKDEGRGEDLVWLAEALKALDIDEEDEYISPGTSSEKISVNESIMAKDSKPPDDDNSMSYVEGDQVVAETRADEANSSIQENRGVGTSSAEPLNGPGPNSTNAEHGASDPRRDDGHASLRRTSTASEVNNEVLEAAVDPIAEVPNDRAPRGLLDEMFDWVWGDMIPQVDQRAVPAQDDEQVIEDPQAEAPFIPARDDLIPPNEHAARAGEEVQDADVVAAARQAGIDPAAGEELEDLEDMEGVMELVGFQGPVEGLFQNALFCTVLVSVVLIVGVWLPFIMGTSFVTTLSDPVLFLFKGPALLLSFLADTFVDCAIILVGSMFYWLDYAIRFLLQPVRWFSPLLGNISQDKAIADTARAQAEHAASRLGKYFVQSSGGIKTIDFAIVSAIEHQALLHVEQRVRNFFRSIFGMTHFILHKVTTEDASTLLLGLWMCVRQIGPMAFDFLYRTIGSLQISLASLSHINLFNIHISSGRRSIPLDFSLVHWSSRDRGIAILFGYLSFTLTGAAYIHLRHWLEGKPKNEKVKGVVADFLYQMGGVLKVIVVIGIEMIIFPLYCGVLLDVALLPLFGSANISSRVFFSKNFPLTSLFVHWFIGTSYMFHFALFVATCRKLMRPGVLYFIKDPDDPDFHPVRDVLDRNLHTQLWKIASSAWIYGALIIVGLGGIVWGIDYLNVDVFPVRWLSSQPAADVPINLIFYNILVPLIVKMFKPTKAWNRVFEWWFRLCAVWLRLSNFLFGAKKPEEQGSHVRRTWRDVFRGEMGDVDNPAAAKSRHVFEEQEDLRAYFLQNGLFARVPASDAVKPLRGHSAFLPVDQYNKRLDGQHDQEFGCHGYKDPKWTMVYIPPHFRLRIVALVGSMWLFLAVAGCSVTILPLAIGRAIVNAVVKGVEGMSDIYAFSIGVAILPMPIYTYNHRRDVRRWLHDTLAALPVSFTIESGRSEIRRLVGLLYLYSTLLVVFPLLLSFILQTYIIIPLHTYFASGTSSASLPSHTIHLLQDWTLGLLYLRLIIKYIFSNRNSRAATAIYLVVPHTCWQPDVWAFTRLWVLPVAVLAADALFSPPALAWALLQTPLSNFYLNLSGSPHDDENQEVILKALIYRYSYTFVIFILCALYLAVKTVQWFYGWKRRIRDEVYLIGERLHNYKREDDRKKPANGKGKAKAKALDKPNPIEREVDDLLEEKDLQFEKEYKALEDQKNSLLESRDEMEKALEERKKEKGRVKGTLEEEERVVMEARTGDAWVEGNSGVGAKAHATAVGEGRNISNG